MCLIKLFYTEKDIKVLAHRLYEKRNQESGYDQGDWFEAKNIIGKRVGWGFFYLILGIILLGYFAIPLITDFFRIYWFEFFWCIGWSMIGAGAGLINTRNQPQSELLHLLGYWGFIIVAVSMVAFTVSLYTSHNIYPYWDLDIKFYSLAALIGLIGGFLGQVFLDLIFHILGFLGKKK